jgi:hypothetical protein
MTISNTFPKDPQAVLDFKFDWASRTNGTMTEEDIYDWLQPGETIVSYILETGNIVATSASIVSVAKDSGMHQLNGEYVDAFLGGDSERVWFDGGVNEWVNLYSTSLSAIWNKNFTLVTKGKVNSALDWISGTTHSLISVYSFPFLNNVIFDISSGGVLEWTYLNFGGFPFNFSIQKPIVTGNLDWMTMGITVSGSAGEIKAYYNGIQENITQTGTINWPNPLWEFGVRVGNPGWHGWASDVIMGFGVVATPDQMLTIYNNLESNTLITSDLDLIFGQDNYAWWKLNEEDSGINIDSSSLTDLNTSVTVWLSGGLPYGDYSLTCKITTSQNRTDERTIVIQSRQR